MQLYTINVTNNKQLLLTTYRVVSRLQPAYEYSRKATFNYILLSQMAPVYKKESNRFTVMFLITVYGYRVIPQAKIGFDLRGDILYFHQQGHILTKVASYCGLHLASMVTSLHSCRQCDFTLRRSSGMTEMPHSG